MSSWWTPFVFGLGLGAFPCLVWIAVTSADGSATWRIGADAEAWTAEELRGLGSSWHIEHAVLFPELGHTATSTTSPSVRTACSPWRRSGPVTPLI